MGCIRVQEFTTLDGVVDAPTWTFDYGFPQDLAAAVAGLTASSSAILLGRNTFEMYAPVWSSRTGGGDPDARFFNRSRKYVVSSTLADPEALWANSTGIDGYATASVRLLKNRVPGDLYVCGSATLVRALLADGLVDELHLFVYPVAIGDGIRLFPEGADRRSLSLLGADVLSNGVMHVTYGPELAAPPRAPVAVAAPCHG